MFKKLLIGLLLYTLGTILARADLPLCPTNVPYFPQNLPMHCRMPANAVFPGFRGPIPTIPPFYQSLPPNQQPLPIPIPVPASAGPGPNPMQGPMRLPGSIPAPAPIQLPGPYPMPIPAGPAHKLPVIVMPFYSPDPSFKKPGIHNMPPPFPPISPHLYRPRKRRIRHRRRRPFYFSSGISSSKEHDISSDFSSDLSWEHKRRWRDRKYNRRSNGINKTRKRNHYQKRELLTPVLQYVTKDGYVIFEKKISKDEAKDWLHVKSEDREDATTRLSPEVEDIDSEEPNGGHSVDRESITRENEKVITNENHRLNRMKVRQNKASKKKFFKPEI